MDKARGPAAPLPGDAAPDYTPEIVPLSFHQIIPLPEQYSQVPYGRLEKPNGYDIEYETWGVKWGPYETKGPTPVDGGFTYEFTTAWVCPKIWLAKASAIWTDLLFIASYGGEGPTRGVIVLKAGHELMDRDDHHEECNYPKYDDELAAKDPEYEDRYSREYNDIQSHRLRTHSELVKEIRDERRFI